MSSKLEAKDKSSDAPVKKLTEIAKYFSELTLLFDFLKNYSLCEKHYNNIVAKSSFIKQLTKTDNSIFLDLNKNNRKKLKISTNDNKFQVFNSDPFEKTFVDFGIRLDERFTDQEDRIKSIIEITKKERSNLFENISNLIKNHKRFSLSSLLEYSSSKWLAERNPVVVKFIKTLTDNENKHYNEGEKFFKRAVVINAIYGSQHLKYVSAINLVASAVKYLLARSKIIVDIDNHIISSAFDNKQKGQKNYLDRRYNTVVFHTVTSFVAFHYDQSNDIQDTDPWLHFEPSKKQYEELFDLSSGMKNEIHEELTNYLTIILEELRIEKNQEKNMIDELVHYQNQTGYMKKCSVCQTSNIDNKKWVYPKCHNKLLIISEINKQFDEPSDITNITEKSININPYIFKEAQSVPESEVYTPQLFVSDQIRVNPNSIANIRKVLEHIKEISGIKDGSHKWFVVTCDGVLYHHIQKIKKDYPWLILIPGALHEEINMYQYAMASELMWPYVISEENLSVEDYLEWAQNQTDPIFKLNKTNVCVYLVRHDTILEEINKALKSLIPPIPSQQHWKIAARYSEKETHGPRVRSSFITKSRRFQVQIRKTQFVNPNVDNRIFQNISEMKRFSEVSRMKRIEFINAKLINKTSLGIWHPIPVTCEEADRQKAENSLTKSQILLIINSLIPLLDDLDQLRFRSLSSKSRDDLINIPQEIRNILNESSINMDKEE
ncbi:hypothetical protein Glove_691g8 [Diversispora epigaea]|uniref:Uncharacterized protein n=1 Tax=Diversispora epigaea TaxID=1348612 RepID=A0A397G6W3_9GLOM|nr:hypothetical protein Glove_691g8 [Diversispora epigaea]